MKKISIFLVLLLLLLSSVQAFALNADVQPNISLDNLASGKVEVRYLSHQDKTVKVLVQKDGLKYFYTINNQGLYESLPLQLGKGSYKIVIYENASGNSYYRRQEQTVYYEPEDPNTVFLQSVQSMAWDEEMEAIVLARELTENLETDVEKVAVVHKFIADNFDYDYDKIKSLSPGYTPDVNAFFSDRRGICYDYSSLFASMLRSVGIPSKLVKGYTVYTSTYHAWNEVYLAGRWQVIDVCYDAQMRSYNKPYEIYKENSKYSKIYEY